MSEFYNDANRDENVPTRNTENTAEDTAENFTAPKDTAFGSAPQNASAFGEGADGAARGEEMKNTETGGAAFAGSTPNGENGRKDPQIQQNQSNGHSAQNGAEGGQRTAQSSAGSFTYSYTRDTLPGNEGRVNTGASYNGARFDPHTGERIGGTGYGTYNGQRAQSGNAGGTPYGSHTYGANGGNFGGAYGGSFGTPYGQGFNGGYGTQSEPPKKPKEKKPKKKVSLTAGTAVLLAVACVVLSLVSGLIGSYVMSGRSNAVYVDKDGNVSSNGGTAVLYRAVETETEDGKDASLESIADLVSDSVVEITTEYVTNTNSFFGQYVSDGAGSGVIISDDGYVVTNNHVIYSSDLDKLASTIKIRLRDGMTYDASVIGRDNDSDIAVLKIDAEGLTAAVWGDSDKLSVGQTIVAVGNPLGQLGGSVTSGIVSSTDREVTVENTKMNLIQIDAAVNPGNSGGGLFNLKGELVGIVNAKSSGTGIEGLGFAIPANDATSTVEQLIEYGYVKGRVYLGISFYEANTGVSYFGSSNETVLYVYGTEKGYNDTVLQRGDRILTIDGEAISSTSDVKSLLKDHSVGDKLKFTVLRNNQTVEAEVTCYEYKPSSGSVTFDN